MPEPLIRKRTPAEVLAYIAEKLRDQPDATALLGHSLTLDMLAEELSAESEPPRVEWANRMELGGETEIAPVGPAREGAAVPSGAEEASKA